MIQAHSPTKEDKKKKKIEFTANYSFQGIQPLNVYVKPHLSAVFFLQLYLNFDRGLQSYL